MPQQLRPHIEIKLERPRVELLFTKFKDLMGDDYPGYRNHVYRTITYAMHFLDNDEQYEQLVETAFVYHDIGLWTDQELAYLEPSELLALSDNAQHEWGLDPDALRGAIHWHHKISAYKGPHQKVIEACRKADWIDATKGTVRKGMSKENIEQVERAFPNLGFHDTLLRLTKDYGGSTVVGGVQVTLGIMKW
ncbi:phosphohydrolase [Vibrio ponticus]|uniref:Phosphohydrolase n=1 Tax=Vibrio ponticus TaxID=265668 RepID=A0ABX3FPU5_9VIBR|nr:phosphohydrolase [Vibrio ponticus]OLQ94473.1 phosphohydrolase [Vibrio ponticus]